MHVLKLQKPKNAHKQCWTILLCASGLCHWYSPSYVVLGQTMLEEVDMRVTEMKKEVYEFKREIIEGAVNPRTGKIVAEKLLQFTIKTLKDKVSCA